MFLELLGRVKIPQRNLIDTYQCIEVSGVDT